MSTAFDRSVLEQAIRALATFRERGLDGLEQRVFGQREFTALFPLRPDGDGRQRDDALREQLKRFAAGSNAAFARLPGLHSARWVLLDDHGGTGNRDVGDAMPDSATGPLLFAAVCDGWPLDVLEELSEWGGPGLDAILCHCEGYPERPTPEARVAYLRKYRVRSSYFYADGRQMEASGPYLHASAREIQRALKLRERFVEFVVNNQGKSAAEQHSAFQDFQTHSIAQERALEANPTPGYPFEQSLFERPLEHEGLWVRRTAEIVRTRARRDIRKRQRQGASPPGLRQVHAKHYGLMMATLRVRDDLPSQLRAGVFVPGAKYTAWVRPSSTSPVPQPDYVPDGHGLSIKLLDVGDRGKSVLAQPIDDGLPPGGKPMVTQDFVLVSHPTFFIKDARDYAILRCIFDSNPDGLAEKAELIASGLLFGARRGRELSIFLRTLLSVVRHPLALEYHSMVPVLVGPREAVKFSLRPTEATRRILTGESLRALIWSSLLDPSNYLRAALQRSLDLLDDSMLEFELAAHMPGELSLPIEDARVDWGQQGAKRVVIATLAIRRQDATSEQQLALGERLIFTPWHALEEHRPLGSLNRSRLFSYLASAEERTAGHTQYPQSLWTPPPSNGGSKPLPPQPPNAMS